MKFVFFVEGYTERKALPEFFKRWLDPKLRQPVGVKIVRFEGWADFESTMARKARMWLSGKTGADVIAVIGLLDLYGPDFYPSGMSDAADRYTWGQCYFAEQVSHPKFRQHFAVHEVEAWLLSDTALFPREIVGALPGRCAYPETVNFDAPPKRLLNQLYRQRLHRRYKEVTDGANLFAQLDPNVAYQKCPHLRLLMDDLLALAREAGL